MNSSSNSQEWLAPVIQLRPTQNSHSSITDAPEKSQQRVVGKTGLNGRDPNKTPGSHSELRAKPRNATPPPKIDSELTEGHLGESSEYNAAMDLAMKYLGPRPRSRREVGDRLRKAGHPGVLIVRILNRLEELEILNDAAYALEAARQSHARGKAGEAIRRALATKGLSRSDIESAIDQVCPEGSEYDLALELALKRALKYAGLPRATAYRRLAGFLAQRGFTGEVVNDVCAEALGELA